MEIVSMYSSPIFYIYFSDFWICKKVDIYDCFVSGAKMGLESTFNIVPSLIGLMVAIAMFRESGCLELITNANPSLLLPT